MRNASGMAAHVDTALIVFALACTESHFGVERVGSFRSKFLKQISQMVAH